MHFSTQLCKAIVPQLDNFDYAILSILQQDNRTPLRTIGEQVHLSAPAVQRRIKAMEESGVIAANTALVDPNQVGKSLTILTEVYIESERLDLLDAIKAAFVAAPEIQQCYYVTGDADFVLVILVATMAEYDALTRRLFFGNPNVKRFRTLVALDRIKTGSAVPLPGLSHS
ncbi:Lrp/AsnC family transcriptional regulator [Massilia sp. BJB1822]|uniref:Lrp/AsnC family transcriptional regulator n=1 Tax=Massilia sp. BJB1822 TaxID=2744470 RepID=UPI0015937B64|nr:Lrp/AsnC family transcriptional regulator [Massilia sp. BJB1822]